MDPWPANAKKQITSYESENECVQREGTVLGGVVLATDGGGTHVPLHRIKNGTVRARDLRLRFEFGGAAAVARPALPEKLDTSMSLAFGQVHCDLQRLFARFTKESGRLESGCNSAEGIAWIDEVLYAGESREFRLDELAWAAVGFCLRLAVENQPTPVVRSRAKDGSLSLETSEPSLTLELPLKPAKISELQGLQRARLRRRQ
jgi:hypothetical protein